jgi:hypothetical protein
VTGDSSDPGAQRLAKVLREISTSVPGLQMGGPTGAFFSFGKGWNDEGFSTAIPGSQGEVRQPG